MSDPSTSEAESGTGFEKWDFEQDYENRPRKKRKHEQEETRLPVKTAEGRIEKSRLPELEIQDEDTEDVSDDEEAEMKDEPIEEAKPVVSPKQQIIDAKEELAKIASLLSEDPEENSVLFRRLSELSQSANLTVKKLTLATQLSIYKDIIPGYRIQALSGMQSDTRISKDVRKLRSFEQSLVAGYQSYVKELSCLARTPEDDMSSIAISCACALLKAVPHFNFRGELLQILTTKLSFRKVDDSFVRCREAICHLFQTDEEGTPSLDATMLLTKMMKTRHYRVDESVLNTFLHLRLLSEFSQRASQTRVDAPSADLSRGAKKLTQKKTFRTKRERKLAKEQKAVAKEMKEADASVSHEERERMQAETLKSVFVTYFRILKLRIPTLMGAVLEGLAKYAHLINQDFFGDLLEALKDLVRLSDLADPDSDDPLDDTPLLRDPSRESLLCIITAFALLQGQAISLSNLTPTITTLNLDLHFFIDHLHSTLVPLSLDPDIERTSRSLHLPDPNAHSLTTTTTTTKKINHTTTIVLLLRCLTHTLTPPPPTPSRAVPPTRLLLFSKTLATMALHLPEKSSLAVLHLLQRVAKLQGRKIAPLWRTEERSGKQGEVGGVWEGELLRLHYSEGVRDAVRSLESDIAAVK